MPTDSYRLGPGTLELGAGQFAMQLSACRITPTENVSEGEDINLLDGTTLEGDDDVTYSYVLSGTAVQDLLAAGFAAFTWENAGDEVSFEFVPVTARPEATFTGTVRIVPLEIGGDVKTRPTSDFTFQCIGTPTPTWETP